MVFSSILFLCLFLPVTLGVYYLLPKGLRNVALLVASLLFYGWGEPKYILIMVFSTLFDYSNGRLLERFQERPKVRKAILILSLVVNLGLLAFFKYTDFAIENLNRLLGTGLPALRLALPIGISFYTFQTLSYTIDVYRNKVAAQHNLLDFGMYICLFPQLIAGPIVRYADIAQQLRDRPMGGQLLWSGLVRFSVGLGKKVLLANQIGGLWEEIAAYSGSQAAATAWLGALAYTFQIYFDFSGYSDMAIGLGQMLGFTFPENFLHPYTATSITDFWRRWHVTLGTWFREYLYIPLGGNRCGTMRQLWNLLVVWALTGLWHGAAWNFVLWGCYYFLLLAVEKLLLKQWLPRWPRLLRHAYTLFWVVLGWVLFACTDLGQLGDYFLCLFGKNGLWDQATLYYLRAYGLFFLLLALGATELPARAAKRLCGGRTEGGQVALQLTLVVLLLGLSLIFLVGDSYNPFLYFRF
jgi:alginate O-acetyltransferase complex protein AlgI